jgi:hypothetical protein
MGLFFQVDSSARWKVIKLYVTLLCIDSPYLFPPPVYMTSFLLLDTLSDIQLLNLYGEWCHCWHDTLVKAKAVPLHATEALGGDEYSSYSFSTSALGGGEWSASRLSRALAPGKYPRYTLYRRLGGPRAGLDTEATGNIFSPLPGIEPRSPSRQARNQTLYWLSYPAHMMY